MRTWRKIESSIVTSDRLSRVSDSAKWLFTLLLVAQDDEGKYPWTKPRIQALTGTTTWDSERTMILLSELSQSGVAELREGFVWLTNGREKNGTPSNSAKYPVLYPPVSNLDTDRELSENSEVRVDKIRDKSREEKSRGELVTSVSHPEWFDPLKALEGYKEGSHAKAIKIIRLQCEAWDIEPSKVIVEFSKYFPAGRVKHGWRDPVATLVKTLEVQIRKVKENQERGRTNGEPRERTQKGIPGNRPVGTFADLEVDKRA